MTDINTLKDEFIKKINLIKTKQDLDLIKTDLFGKSGKITFLFKNIANLDVDKKKNMHLI